MSTHDTRATRNGHGSAAWSRSWTHLRIDRRSPGYCGVTFDHAPINTITATTVAELAELVDLIEQDPDLKVVVFGRLPVEIVQDIVRKELAEFQTLQIGRAHV